MKALVDQLRVNASRVGMTLCVDPVSKHQSLIDFLYVATTLVAFHVPPLFQERIRCSFNGRAVVITVYFPIGETDFSALAAEITQLMLLHPESSVWFQPPRWQPSHVGSFIVSAFSQRIQLPLWVVPYMEVPLPIGENLV